MSNNSQYKQLIIEKIQEKKSLTFKELESEVMIELGKVKTESVNKNYLESLIYLLKGNKILVDGYDPSTLSKGKRYQANKDLINGLIIRYKEENSPSDVSTYLNQLEDPDNEDAYNKLRKLFRDKTRQFEDLYFKMWENELSKVDHFVLSERIKKLNEVIEEEKFYLKIIEGISPAMYKSDSAYNLKVERNNTTPGKPVKVTKKVNPIEIMREKFKFLIGVRLGEILKWDEIVKKHENAKLWFILDDNKKSFKHTDELIDKEGSMNPEIALNKILNKKNPEKKLPDPENLLEMKTEDYSPIECSDEEIDDIFRKILFYINIQDNPRFLNSFFSLALSDDKESLNWFEYFFKNIPLIIPSLEKKLSENLNVVPKYTWKPIEEGVEEGYKGYGLVQNW